MRRLSHGLVQELLQLLVTMVIPVQHSCTVLSQSSFICFSVLYFKLTRCSLTKLSFGETRRNEALKSGGGQSLTCCSGASAKRFLLLCLYI